ncbi:hypothetical protein [Streptomyces sp. NPDC059224]|uniref:hypothetical protein n=1 Tax=Streptomyces sp. NPDC059224 TaxID=3346775 RepID=UPI003695C042
MRARRGLLPDTGAATGIVTVLTVAALAIGINRIVRLGDRRPATGDRRPAGGRGGRAAEVRRCTGGGPPDGTALPRRAAVPGAWAPVPAGVVTLGARPTALRAPSESPSKRV